MTFVFAKTHPLVEPCWLAVFRTAEELIQAHKWIATKFMLSVGQDPHIVTSKGEPAREDNVTMHPVELAARWISTAFSLFFRNGVVYMGQRGGMCHNPEILETVESDVWPGGFKGEAFLVTKWPNGTHYYIRTRSQRVLPVEKFDSMEEVRKYVGKIAPGASITVCEPHTTSAYIYKNEGD